MAGSIHYEVFVRKGKAGGWSLHGAHQARDAAIADAKAQLAEGAAAGVRVMKETFSAETGDFMSLKVFEDGDVSEPKKKAAAGTGSSLPCFKPDDFYSFHGKRTIARLLRDALTRWGITATELLHHPGHIERLELTGTVMQHAVQKAAVKHAGATGEPVQQIMKQLNELVSRAIERVVLDGRNNRLPKIGKEGFGALCVKLADQPAAEYMLNAAIAHHLDDTKTWGEKLDRVIRLMTSLPDAEVPRALGLKLIDSLVAEMLEGNAALADLLGEQPDLGAALLKMADLFVGRLNADTEESIGVKALCREFARGNLIHARAAIANRVLHEIKGQRRLKPTSLDDEVQSLRLLATRMVMGQGSLASSEEIMEAFVARSKQLVMPTAVERYLDNAKRPEDKLEKLYVLEENVIGAANKRELVGFVMGILNGPRTEVYFLESNDPVTARLTTLASLHARNQRSGFQEIPKRQVAERIEAIATSLEHKFSVLDTLVKTASHPADALERLAQLVAGGGLPEGAPANAARERLKELLKKPGVQAALQTVAEARRNALSELLRKAIPETGKSDAA